MTKKVIIKIKELTEQRGISLRELSRQADIRHAALSELANHKKQSISFHHIEKLADALDIDDIRKIIDLASSDQD